MAAMNNFDCEQFLQECWQQKPLLVRNAFSDPYWLNPDELAGLALDEDVESRIIRQTNGVWSVDHGPFSEQHFARLPERDWTLLVQGVDVWVPQVKALLQQFQFLPRWRLDDVMVSYAPEGGTVSQHYDYFDVFLIQGTGQRRWQVGQRCAPDAPLLPDTPVRILRDFEPMMDVVMEPGDMLYVPARFAHLGVSEQDSMTYSVGFRAPSSRDMVDGVAGLALELADASLHEAVRYEDCAESLQALPGEIPDVALQRVRAMLERALLQPEVIAQWLGQYVTERKYPELELVADDEPDWLRGLQEGETLYRNSASRIAFYRRGTQSVLFVDGNAYPTDTPLAEALAAVELDVVELSRCAQASAENYALLDQLFDLGVLTFIGPDAL